jgi:hypothetical protein
MATANKIIISCAGDNELAKELHDYLLANLKTTKLNIKDFMSLTVDEIEITDYLAEIPRQKISDLLTSFLDSNRALSETHDIIQLENVFTVGVKTDLLKEMRICEFCGYMSKEYHDMYHHRLRCAFVARLGI